MVKKGYSLVELVIVVGLISILSISISAVVLMTIVNSNRIKNEVRIRQVGDFALGQITTLVRNSRTVTQCDPISDTLVMTGLDGGSTTIGLSGTAIASNSATITPTDITISSYSLGCVPTGTSPTLIQLSFTAAKAGTNPARENQPQTFTTSIELRNR